MLTAAEITKRVECLEGDLPAKTKDALRKNKERGHLPSLPTLFEAAKAKGTSIAYLIGETDNPSSIESRPTCFPDQALEVRGVDVGIAPEGYIALLAVTDAGEARLVIPPERAAYLIQILGEAIRGEWIREKSLDRTGSDS